MSVEQQEKQSFLKRPIGGGSGKTKTKDSAPKAGKLGIPQLPQVNLMPPEIIEGRRLAVLKRGLVWSIIALLVVVVLAFGASYLLKITAEDRYEGALSEADALLAQKKQYAPVIQVQSDINKTVKAREFVLSTEVDWSNYAYAIQAVLPDGVTIQSLSVAGIAPGDSLAEGADDLTRDGIAIINFNAKSETLPDAAAWIEALSTVPGLADINLQSSVLQDESGEVTYLVTATAQVTEEALAHRTFSDQEPAADDTDEEE